MSRPWSPQEVEERLEKGVDALDEAAADYLTIKTAASAAKADLELSKARAMLRFRSQDPRAPKHILEANVTVECEQELREALLTDATEEGARRALDTMKTQVEALRTLLVQSRGVIDPRR